MKLIKKIRAFFTRDDESVEMDIVAAEIREGKAYLHPKENPKKTYFIRADPYFPKTSLRLPKNQRTRRTKRKRPRTAQRKSRTKPARLPMGYRVIALKDFKSTPSGFRCIPRNMCCSQNY